MSSQVFTHYFLVQGEDLKEAVEKVKNFLENYQLVNYDNFSVDEGNSPSATEKNFWKDLEEALEKNVSLLRNYLSELKREGSILTLFL